MSKWIFRYIRADLEEIDMGPYPTEYHAQKAADEMSNFGAIISSKPIEVSDDYKLYKGADKEN